MTSIARLKELYSISSKHSNYQILSNKLTSIIGKDQINVKSRYERERFEYILRNIPVGGKRILDIGGNSGFFTFEVLARDAQKVIYYEGNKAHSDFVTVASEVLHCTDRIEINNEYYDFISEDTKNYDLVFLLNVLHHLGDDYGDTTLSINAAKEQMAIQLIGMARKTRHLVFQLGFNWKGNRNICLFKNGTKKELIDFVTNSVSGIWEIKNIGIPVKKGGDIIYCDLEDQNSKRDDSLGEFLNRPLFIMRSKQCA